MKKTNLISKTIDSLKWNYLMVIITGLFQLVHTAIISRIVERSAFGLIAMATTILRFGIYFSRMGIGSAVIQKEKLTKEDIRAGFTLSVGLSLFFTGVIYFAAPLSNLLFNSTELVSVVKVYSLTLFFNGLNIIGISLLRRQFKFQALAIIETASFFIGSIVVGIPLAYFRFGVWSLVIASLVQGLSLSIMAYAIVRHPISPLFSIKKFSPLISFGGRVSLISFLEFINYNLDTIIIGSYLGTELLGIYNRALHVVSMPSEKISNSLIKVLFSSFSEIQSDTTKSRKAHLISIEFLGFVMFIFAFAISGAAREIVLVILGKQWLEAIPILRILSLSIPFSLINSINGILFEANAWLNIKIILIILRLIVLGGLLFIGLNYGLIGVSIVILIISILYYIGFLYFSSERLKESFLELFQLNTSIITAGTISFILTFASSFILNKLNLSSIFILAFQGCIGAALLFIFFFLTPSRSIVIFFNQYLNNDDALPSIFVIDLFKKRYNILHKNIK